MFVVVELLIAVKILIYSFGSSNSLAQIMGNVDQALDQLGSGVSTITRRNDVSGPVTFLLLVLGFMIFSYILMTALPRIESESDEESEWWDLD